jgi:glycosyltransferase involved in cell wall biosynthesis
MRICVVMEYHPADLVGGSETQAFGMAREFARAGHEVFYVCQRYDHDRPVDESNEGVRVLRALRWHKVFRFLVAARLFRTLRHLRPDIIYQRFASPLTGLAAVAARSMSIPFIWGCSEDRTLELRFLTRLQKGRGGSPAQQAKRVLLSVNARISQSLFCYGLRHAQALVVQNQVQLESLKRNFGLSGVVIPNGVTLPAERTQESQEPVVLWLSRFGPRKNVEAFIDLARSMETRRPDVRFVIVGGRQDDEYLKSIYRSSADVSNIEFAGSVPQPEAQRWLDQAWLLVFTSTNEGFPNVLLQAWASRVPVVSLVIDPDGIMAREGFGLVSGTVDQLHRDVVRVLGDRSLREELGEASRAYVAEHFEFSKVAQQYLALFQAITVR